MKAIKLTVILVSGIYITGCASIMHGPMQNVAIGSSPDGANAHFKPKSPKGEEITVKTPATVSLHRKFAYDVTVEKEGYQPQTRQITKTMDGWLLGNIILGGLIGIIIDAITGSTNKLEPANIQVDLQKKVEAFLRDYLKRASSVV